VDTPLISVCIPTYRRSAFLAKALETVAAQATAEIEVVITEDPSDDVDTSRVVETFRARLRRLTHVVNETRLQFDGNCLRVISLARGHYCWLLSDDDMVEPGGVARVIRALTTHEALTGLTLNRRGYDRAYARSVYERPFRQRGDRLFTDLRTMFLALLDQLGFLSGTVLNRARLTEALSDTRVAEFVGSGYAQLFLSVLMMQRHPKWLYLADPCVGWRRDNDSFVERGSLGRLRMDVEGYDRIASAFFPRESPTFREAASEVVSRHVRHHIVHAKLDGATPDFTRQALELCLRHYARLPAFWFRTFPILLLPRPVLRALRAVYQRSRHMAGR
jgi:abequosyltransferase